MSKRKFFLFLALAAILALLLGMYFRPANRLIRAIRKGQTEVVARLLEQGVDPNETDVPPGRWTYLQYQPGGSFQTAENARKLAEIRLFPDGLPGRRSGRI